jgi:anti-sigma B factor antagonist
MSNKRLPNDFSIEMVEEGSVLRLRCGGELDIAAAPLVEEALNAVLERAVREILLDWSGITFMDSTGIRLLLKTLALCRNKNVDLTWALSDAVRRTLDRVGIHDTLLRDYSAGTAGPTPDGD